MVQEVVVKCPSEQSAKGDCVGCRRQLRAEDKQEVDEGKDSVKYISVRKKHSLVEKLFGSLSAKRNKSEAPPKAALRVQGPSKPAPVPSNALPLSTGRAALVPLSEGVRVFNITCHPQAPTLKSLMSDRH